MAMAGSRKTGQGLYRPLAEINVTPLVDVMLVLLIVFMITAPMLAAGLPVNLPQARAALPLDPKEPVIVTVAKGGQLLLGSEPIGRERLAEAVRGKLAGDRRAVHVRGDREAPYGEIVAVMDELARHGLTRIALVASARGAGTEPPSDAGTPPR